MKRLLVNAVGWLWFGVCMYAIITFAVWGTGCGCCRVLIGLCFFVLAIPSMGLIEYGPADQPTGTR